MLLAKEKADAKTNIREDEKIKESKHGFYFYSGCSRSNR